MTRRSPSGSALLDTSVILASLDADEPAHVACDRLLAEGKHRLYVHALAETFSILTGGRGARRLDAAIAARLIRESVLPFVEVVDLSGADTIEAIEQARARGIRGGASYDDLHLVAARKSRAVAVFTLDARDFQAFARPGHPPIASPSP